MQQIKFFVKMNSKNILLCIGGHRMSPIRMKWNEEWHQIDFYLHQVPLGHLYAFRIHPEITLLRVLNTVHQYRASR